MKNLTIMFIFLLFGLSCELETEKFDLTYKVESEDPVSLDVTYKLGESYITETAETPFEITRETELNDEGLFYFYLQTKLLSSDDLNKKIYGYVYADGKSVGNLYNDPYWPESTHITSGYTGNGENSSTVTIDLQ